MTERRPFSEGAYRGSLAEAAVEAVYVEMIAEDQRIGAGLIPETFVETDEGVKLRPRTSLMGPWMGPFRKLRREQARAVWPWLDTFAWNGEVPFDRFRRRPYDYALDGAA